MFKCCATYGQKALDEGYNFALDFILIGGLHAKIWVPKAAKIPVVKISRLSLGSPRTKCHLDVSLVERQKIYYKGGKWWLPLSSGCGESCGFKFVHGLS